MVLRAAGDRSDGAIKACSAAPSGWSVRGDYIANPSPALSRCSGAFLPWLSWIKPPATPRSTCDRETTPIEKLRTKITKGSCNNNDVTIRVAQPDLAVVCVRVDPRAFQHLGVVCVCPIHGRIEFVGLEPQQHAIARRLDVRIAHVPMFVRFPVVKLHNHAALADDLLIPRAAMPALAPQHGLVPAAAGRNVMNGASHIERTASSIKIGSRQSPL